MKHMRVPMVPLGEELFATPQGIYGNLVARAQSIDAVFLVAPNNPTGTSLLQPTDHAFREIVCFCVEQDIEKIDQSLKRLTFKTED